MAAIVSLSLAHSHGYVTVLSVYRLKLFDVVMKQLTKIDTIWELLVSMGHPEVDAQTQACGGQPGGSHTDTGANWTLRDREADIGRQTEMGRKETEISRQR